MVSVSVSISNTISTSVQVTEVVNASASVLGCSTESPVCDYTKPTIEIDDSNIVVLQAGVYSIDFGTMLDVNRSGSIVLFAMSTDYDTIVSIQSDNTIPDGYELHFIARASLPSRELDFKDYTGVAGGIYSSGGILYGDSTFYNGDDYNMLAILRYDETTNKFLFLFTPAIYYLTL